MERVYAERIDWRNYPDIKSPINDVNLNKMDYALFTIDGRVINLDTAKANQGDLLNTIKNVDYNTETGVFIFTFWNETQVIVDLNIEKIPVSFSMSKDGIITMTAADGTEYTADVGSLIKAYTFSDGSRIKFNVTVSENGENVVTADIVKGSITDEYLQPNYLADIRVEANKSSQSATDAQNSANAAALSAERAKEEADRAASIVNIDLATTEKAGIVKLPEDGTITMDENGAIHAEGGAGASSWDELTDKPFESIGNGLSVDEEGNLNAEGEALPENVVYFEGNALKDKDGNEILPKTSASNVNLNDNTTVENKIGTLTEGLNTVNSNLKASDNLQFRFATDGEGNYGYLGADDSFIPFKGGEVKELLWTNPNPTSAFGAQTVSLDLSEYKAVIIDLTIQNNITIIGSTEYINIGETRYGGVVVNGRSGGGRSITVTDSGVAFGNGYAGTSDANVNIIPYHIYGIKDGIPSANPTNHQYDFYYIKQTQYTPPIGNNLSEPKVKIKDLNSISVMVMSKYYAYTIKLIDASNGSIIQSTNGGQNNADLLYKEYSYNLDKSKEYFIEVAITSGGGSVTAVFLD